jgi:hypothetical protein
MTILEKPPLVISNEEKVSPTGTVVCVHDIPKSIMQLMTEKGAFN